MTGEVEPTRFFIDTEDRNVVAALVAAIEKLARGIKAEAAWIIPARPSFLDERQVAGWSHGKNPDAVVQPIAGINESPIRGNENFRAEIAAGKPRWQRADRLPRR